MELEIFYSLNVQFITHAFSNLEQPHNRTFWLVPGDAKLALCIRSQFESTILLPLKKNVHEMFCQIQLP